MCARGTYAAWASRVKIWEKNLIYFYELARVSESGAGGSSRRVYHVGVGE